MTFPVGSPGAQRPEHLLNRRRSMGGETPRTRPLIRPQRPDRRYRAPWYRPVHGRPNMPEPAACGREYGLRLEASLPWSGPGAVTTSGFPRRGPVSPADMLDTPLDGQSVLGGRGCAVRDDLRGC